jgi:beta-1,2-N-acetylglucosaminyltransferase
MEDMGILSDGILGEMKHNANNVLYIRMNGRKDYTRWLVLAKCLRVWDLDARGYHRGMWRFTFKNRNTHLFVVGVPFSDYSKYIPRHISPVYLDKSSLTTSSSGQKQDSGNGSMKQQVLPEKPVMTKSSLNSVHQIRPKRDLRNIVVSAKGNNEYAQGKKKVYTRDDPSSNP